MPRKGFPGRRRAGGCGDLSGSSPERTLFWGPVLTGRGPGPAERFAESQGSPQRISCLDPGEQGMETVPGQRQAHVKSQPPPGDARGEGHTESPEMTEAAHEAFPGSSASPGCNRPRAWADRAGGAPDGWHRASEASEHNGDGRGPQTPCAEAAAETDHIRKGPRQGQDSAGR